MGELRDLEKERRKRLSRAGLNPGYRSHTSRRPVALTGTVVHRCPCCKKALGESDATVFQRKCPSCGKYVMLKKS